MDGNSAKNLVEEVFKLLKESNSINDLDKFEKIELLPDSIISFYHRTNNNYPIIPFTFTKDEIIDLENKLNNLKPETINDPLTKLYYAMLWKQGDLPKLKHIVYGLAEKEKNDMQGIVLHQFGRFLKNKKHHPIVDQHVIRAFKSGTDIINFENYRKINSLEKEIHKTYISEYIDWIRELKPEIKSELREEYLFKVDRILMALGKAIKKTK